MSVYFRQILITIILINYNGNDNDSNNFRILYTLYIEILRTLIFLMSPLLFHGHYDEMCILEFKCSEKL